MMHDKNADADIINEKMQYAHEETFCAHINAV